MQSLCLSLVERLKDTRRAPYRLGVQTVCYRLGLPMHLVKYGANYKSMLQFNAKSLNDFDMYARI